MHSSFVCVGRQVSQIPLGVWTFLSKRVSHIVANQSSPETSVFTFTLFYKLTKLGHMVTPLGRFVIHLVHVGEILDIRRASIESPPLVRTSPPRRVPLPFRPWRWLHTNRFFLSGGKKLVLNSRLKIKEGDASSFQTFDFRFFLNPRFLSFHTCGWSK